MEKLLLNFTDTYKKDDYADFEYIDMTQIPGTDMYLDEEADNMVSEILSNKKASGIHLIDSGNYHYMTEVFLRKINEPYYLIYFDNHTDMKPAMFDMLSCGSWVKRVLENHKNAIKVVMIGPPQKSVDELDDKLREDDKLSIVTREEIENSFTKSIEKILQAICGENAAFGNEQAKVYLSVDKDVLAAEEVVTNWDQGTMKFSNLLKIIAKICEIVTVIGADICGLLPNRDGSGEEEYYAGMKTDRMLIDEIIKV